MPEQNESNTLWGRFFLDSFSVSIFKLCPELMTLENNGIKLKQHPGHRFDYYSLTAHSSGMMSGFFKRDRGFNCGQRYLLVAAASYA